MIIIIRLIIIMIIIILIIIILIIIMIIIILIIIMSENRLCIGDRRHLDSLDQVGRDQCLNGIATIEYWQWLALLPVRGPCGLPKRGLVAPGSQN